MYLTYAEYEALRIVKGLLSKKKLYPWYASLANPTLFVISGQFRCPLKGEYYLSGAIPQVYRSPNDLPTKYHIMREALTGDSHCLVCEQSLPIERG